ncbi:hypothetical protein O3M35_005346 [Rhynocoris fuscipes]|uniref:Chromodomain-helicase-DNA-binding protein 1-like C-terminal domain-containing protein n=1 Tax=Rhynocoris fuscipes TaxID=488301 RepID=A0AAW1DQH2_9HEMI
MNVDKKYEERQKKKKRTLGINGPIHITVNETKSLKMYGKLDETIFTACKEHMRPARKYLKALNTNRKRLLKRQIVPLGNHIYRCLTKFDDASNIKVWKGRLWYFVSLFTTYKPKKLCQLYKSEIRKLRTIP